MGAKLQKWKPVERRQGDNFKKCTAAWKKIGILTDTLLRSIFSKLGNRLGMMRTSSYVSFTQEDIPSPVSFGQFAAMIFSAGADMAARQFCTSTSIAFGNLFFKIHSSFFSVLSFSLTLVPKLACVHSSGSKATLFHSLQVRMA